MIPARPVQTNCRLCDRLFCYFRVTAPRIYCTPCVEREREHQKFFMRRQRAIRRAERKAA